MSGPSRKSGSIGFLMPIDRDYHNGDAREDEAYRHWLEERHRAYVAFERLDETDGGSCGIF